MVNWKVLVALLVLCVFGALGWYLQLETAQPVGPLTPPVPSKQQPIPVVEEQPHRPRGPSNGPESWVLVPPSGRNDSAVLAAANNIAPALAQWLTPDEQVRKWVAAVDQIAVGRLPRDHRPLNYPMAPFQVKHDGKWLVLDTANYQRGSELINVITEISPALLARYYYVWYAELDKAYLEIGGRGGFDKRLRAAIKQLRAVQPLKSPPELIRPGVYYRYANARLEHATDVEKWLWRLGPANAKRLQDYLGKFEKQL
jgi:hypothetical protein